MILKQLTNEVLLSNLQKFAAEEKKLIKLTIEYLEEVECRKLYLHRGFSSMFAFCTEFLMYTPQEAQTRIQAMRLARQVPEIKSKLNDGKISLTVAAYVQTHVAREFKTTGVSRPELAVSLIAKVEGKTVREAEKILFATFPSQEILKPNLARQVGARTKRLEVNLTEEIFAKLEEVKSLRSHVNPMGDWALLINDLAELALNKWHPLRRLERATKRKKVAS